MNTIIDKTILCIISIAIAASFSGCAIESPILDLIQVQINRESLSSIEYREMESVTGGSYSQTDGTETFEHKISSFTIARYEVTYSLWYAIYNWAVDNGYIFSHFGKEGNDGIAGAAPTSAMYEPVTDINWRDALIWCNAYSEMTGLTPVYYSNPAKTAVLKVSTSGTNNDAIEGSIDNPFVNWTADGYRLPTEGEWQFAAGNKGVTPWDAVSGNPVGPYSEGDYVWYSVNSDGTTQKVGTKLANELNLHDMSGNVFEWCWDWKEAYPSGNQVDYKGGFPDPGAFSAADRVMRGGAYHNSLASNFFLISYRHAYPPYLEADFLGFRLATSN